MTFFIISFLATCLSAIIEALFLPFPLVLLCLIFCGIYRKSGWIFFLALCGGVILDTLTFSQVGQSSIFFIIILGVLLLYSRKFETNHFLFGTLFTAISGFGYLILSGSQHVFFAFLATIILALFVFALQQSLLPSKNETTAHS